MYSSRKSLLSEALQTASATLGEAERKSQGTLNLPPLCPGLAQSSSGSYLEAHGRQSHDARPRGRAQVAVVGRAQTSAFHPKCWGRCKGLP